MFEEREVFIKELGDNVLVTRESYYNNGDIIEGSSEDDRFYAYVDDDVFETYSDAEFEKYVNEMFN